MIRDAFDLAKEKAKDRKGAIIFIDEVGLSCRLHDCCSLILTRVLSRSA